MYQRTTLIAQKPDKRMSKYARTETDLHGNIRKKYTQHTKIFIEK